MRVLCLNVRSGGAPGGNSILQFADSQEPDVVIFPEWRRDASAGRAEAWTASRNMRWACADDGATRNGVAIDARPKFDCVSVTPGNGSAGTLLRASFEGLTMLPVISRRARPKAATSTSVATSRRSAQAPLLVDRRPEHRQLGRRQGARGSHVCLAPNGSIGSRPPWSSSTCGVSQMGRTRDAIEERVQARSRIRQCGVCSAVSAFMLLRPLAARKRIQQPQPLLLATTNRAPSK